MSRYRVSRLVREARQRAHDLGGSEHADVRVGLQEPARRHRDVGRAHPGRRAAGARTGRAGWRGGSAAAFDRVVATMNAVPRPTETGADRAASSAIPSGASSADAVPWLTTRA